MGIAQHLESGCDVRAVETALTSAAGPGRNQFVSIAVGQLSGRTVHDDITADGVDAAC